MGAWIEIPRKSETTPNKDVAPVGGAGIEINAKANAQRLAGSLLSWERGLKWVLKFQDQPDRVRRSSRGSVD